MKKIGVLVIRYLIALILLIMGGFIYYAFRSETLVMFDWAAYMGFDEDIYMLRDSLVHVPIPEFVKYCLPNALWTISYLIAADALIEECSSKLLWAISLPIIAAVLEFCQAFYIIPGTFDFLDVICFMLPAISYVTYYIYYEKHC